MQIQIAERHGFRGRRADAEALATSRQPRPVGTMCSLQCGPKVHARGVAVCSGGDHAMQPALLLVLTPHTEHTQQTDRRKHSDSAPAPPREGKQGVCWLGLRAARHIIQPCLSLYACCDVCWKNLHCTNARVQPPPTPMEGDERGAVFQVIVKLFENGPGAVSSGAPAATQLGCSRTYEI